MNSSTIRPNFGGYFPMAPVGKVFDLALGNGSQFRCLLAPCSSGLFLAVERFGAYTFAVTAHPGYVATKLGFGKYLGDAANFADFINDQLSGCTSGVRVGTYHSSLTADGPAPVGAAAKVGAE